MPVVEDGADAHGRPRRGAADRLVHLVRGQEVRAARLHRPDAGLRAQDGREFVDQEPLRFLGFMLRYLDDGGGRLHVAGDPDVACRLAGTSGQQVRDGGS
ncbi:hypothetical protein [Streptomyces ipomoeae]|uniref:hypothetical protein n=1 Tax=Streptomyces ipomoeae TaxID=103232 RepID=UPI0029B78749|nr:hypothetical protein [Streptomyces ipomoeae]MDX2692183.1 hypothetical protein [Streptomyces ipomoeae]